MKDRPPATETAAIEALKRRGFTASLKAEHGHVLDVETGAVRVPGQLTIRDFYRFEGNSDPDDMSVVYALESDDGMRGILIDAYGSYADPAVGRVLEQIPEREAP